MIIKIQALTKNGQKAIQAMYKATSIGVAKKKMLSDGVLEVKLFNLSIMSAMKNNAVMNKVVRDNWAEILKSYGAEPKDYTLSWE